MALRRELLSYLGVGAIGGIVGYYAGAQELLGIQSEEVVRRSTEDTPTEDTPTEDTPTEDTPTEDTPTEDSSGGGSGLVSTGFPRYQYDNKNTGEPPNTVGPGGSPSVRWRVRTDGNNHTTPVIHNSTAYFGGGGGSDNQDNNVYAVDIDSGEEVWRFENSAAFQSSAAVGDHAIYIADNSGTLFALEHADGTELWSADFGQASYTPSPTVVNGTVYIGDPEVGGVYGFASQTGEQVWSFETQASVTSSPAVTAGTVYIGTEDGTVFAVSISDGSANWEFDAAGEVTGAPVVQNRRVYVTTAEGTIHSLTTEDGTEQWVTEADETIRSSPAIDETSLYVGDGRRFEQPGKLYSLDLDSGTIEWTFDTEGSYGGRQGAIEESPTVGSERVYFGVDANKVYAVNKDDGTEAWQFDTAVVLSSPSIYEGTLYIGNDNNTVLALE